MNKAIKYSLFIIVGMLFIGYFSTIQASPIQTDITVPSELSIRLNEDLTNTISDFVIENHMSVPITINKIEVGSLSDWSLATNQTSFALDEKKINLSIEGTSLQLGNNVVDILIENDKQLNIDIYRGGFTQDISTSSAFELIFNYEIGQKEFQLTLTDNEKTSIYSLKNGESFQLPKPERNGYQFIGWLHQETHTTYLEKDSFIMPIGDTTLTASWKPLNYKITYNLDGGSFTTDYPNNYTIETTTFILPTPSKPGYSFKGWTMNDISNPTKQLTIEQGSIGDLMITAHWGEPDITLLFDNSLESFQTITTSKASDLPIPTKEGYTFDGWYLAKEINTLEITTFNNPNTTYDWIFTDGIWSSTNQGKNSSTSSMVSEPFTLTANGTLTFEWKSFGENNYDYLGYDIYDVNKKSYLSKQSTPTYKNCLNTLKGKASNNFIKETKELNPGTYQLLFMYGKDSSVNSNEDKGYVRNVVCSGFQIFDCSDIYRPDSFTQDILLIAKWKPIEYTYNIINQSTTGLILESTSHTYPYGTSLTINPPNYTGYTTPKSQQITWDQPSKTIIFSYTPLTYQITYTLNGGINSSNTLSTYTIESGTVYLPTPTKEGYDFMGWYNTNNYSGNSIISFNSSDLCNKVFYALWQKTPTYLLSTGYIVNKNIPDKTTKIIFTDIHAPSTFSTIDLSYEKDNSIVGWLDNTTFYISSQKQGQKVTANPNSSGMFRDKNCIESFDFTNLDTRQVTDMSYMFYQLNITNLDLRLLNTQNVEDMQYMFRGSKYLTSLDLSTFNTSKVKNMRHMFYDCNQLKTVNMSGWNTSKVEDMNDMFYFCRSLVSIDLSHFDTSSLTNTSWMFYNCPLLEYLDFSSFDMSKITNMQQMFGMNYALKTIKIGNKWKFLNGYFPTQHNQWLPGADGYWYNNKGNAYTVEELATAFNAHPSQMAGAYYALKP